jgi:tRNA uridine 5-carbamoylmethylation protein Kti12
MTKLYIIRGLPGSGKSTYARQFIRSQEDAAIQNFIKEVDMTFDDIPGFLHIEADMFFETDTNYNFDTRLLRTAHQWCYANAVKHLRNGFNVVVSNTFTTMKEMAKYLEINDFVDDVAIEVIEIKTQFKSVHNIPDEKFQQMKDRWQEIPEELGLKITKILPVPNDEDLGAYNEERLVSKYDKEKL